MSTCGTLAAGEPNASGALHARILLRGQHYCTEPAAKGFGKEGCLRRRQAVSATGFAHHECGEKQVLQKGFGSLRERARPLLRNWTSRGMAVFSRNGASGPFA